VHLRDRLKLISFAKSANLFRGVTEKRNLKKDFSLSVVFCDRNLVNRISRLKVGVSMVVYQMSWLSQRDLVTILLWDNELRTIVQL